MKSQLINKTIAELLGHITLQEKVIAEMVSRIEEQDRRIVEMERRLSRVVSSSQLVSEARAAKLLDLSKQTLARWRKSQRPPIPVLTREGVIRYRVEDIEKFVHEGTRGSRFIPKAA